jgi:alpha-galactosidase
MSSKEKIVLIGAGSLQFGLGAVGSILKSRILKGCEIWLHDISKEALDLVFRTSNLAIEKKNLDFTLKSTLNRKEALENATFIINSIEVTPRFELMEQDIEIPNKFGSRQVLGENGGPGGLFHSLRVIPPILEICEDINKICPDALLINFSNPMSRICLAIKRKFPTIKFVGLCHELEHHVLILSRILDTPLSNLEFKAGGLNHFGVFLEINYKDTGRDAYPDVRKNGLDYLRNLKTLDGHKIMDYILEKYGYLPYTTDSHYGEYLQWAWEIADKEGIKRFIDTYKQSLSIDNDKLIKAIKDGKGARYVRPDGERAIPIIDGIVSDSNHQETSVNLPNDNIITNIPRDLVVECPAIINKDGLHAVKLGEYPKGLAGLLRNQASVQDLVVQAILTNSKEIALQALLVDPVVESASQAEKILDEMLRVQAKHIKLE